MIIDVKEKYGFQIFVTVTKHFICINILYRYTCVISINEEKNMCAKQRNICDLRCEGKNIVAKCNCHFTLNRN